MKKMLRLIPLALIISLAPLTSAFAFGDAQHAEEHRANQVVLDDSATLSLQVPVFSASFAGTPVAFVNEHPVLLGQLTPVLTPVHDEMPLPTEGAAKALTTTFNRELDKVIAERSQGKTDVRVERMTVAGIDKDRNLLLNAPLFSLWYGETPVAEIDQEPIVMAEFSRDLKASYGDMTEENHHSTLTENAQHLLDRLIAVRLVALEARNIGLDQTATIRKQVDDFAEKTLLYALLNKQLAGLTVDEKEANKLYRDISLEGKFESYRFSTQEDAVAILKALEEKKSFDALIKEAIAQGKAVKEPDAEYTSFKNLLPQIATDAKEMKAGDISKIYTKADGFLIFRLVDKRFMEDPAALQFARKAVWDRQVASQGEKYVSTLVDEKAVFNKEAEAAIDFAKIKEKNPEIKLGEALAPLLTDNRVLATVKGAETEILTVAEFAGRLNSTFYHGTDIPLDVKEVEGKKDQILTDILFRRAGTLVAKNLGLDKEQDYRLQVEEFERKTLFDNFVQKAVVPDVTISEEEVRQYYDDNLQKYSTPTMLRVKSLPFYRENDARDALKKLQGGSDFKWVAANSSGLVPVENKDLLTFGNSILSLTSLPAHLQKEGESYRTGDAIVFDDPGKFFYVLYFEKVYPPEPKPYDQVREEIRQIIFQNKVEETLEMWIGKLREAYDTRIYLSGQAS